MVNEDIVKSQRRWSVSSFYLFLTESGKSHGLIVNIRLTIEMHNLRGERFVMFTPYYEFVQYLILNFCQCLFKLKCK